METVSTNLLYHHTYLLLILFLFNNRRKTYLTTYLSQTLNQKIMFRKKLGFSKLRPIKLL